MTLKLCTVPKSSGTWVASFKIIASATMEEHNDLALPFEEQVWRFLALLSSSSCIACHPLSSGSCLQDITVEWMMEEGVLPNKYKRTHDTAELEGFCGQLVGTLNNAGITEKGELFELSPDGLERAGINAALSSHFRSDRCGVQKKLKGECLLCCCNPP